MPRKKPERLQGPKVPLGIAEVPILKEKTLPCFAVERNAALWSCWSGANKIRVSHGQPNSRELTEIVVCVSSQSRTSSHPWMISKKLFSSHGRALNRPSPKNPCDVKGLRATIKEGSSSFQPPLHERLNFCSRMYFRWISSMPNLPLGKSGAKSAAGGPSIKLK